MPKPERVLVFRSAPLFPSEDLFDHLFQVWPDACADLVVQDGCTLGDGLPFASRLRIKPVPFTAEDFLIGTTRMRCAGNTIFASCL